MAKVKHSVTLYGFGEPYMRGDYSFDDVLQKAKRLNADGIEIVAPQMVPGHPNPTEDWIAYFKDACQHYELDPVCYSVYIDSGKHKGRFLNFDERFAETINEMEVAKKLGCKIVRSQDALLPSTMEKLLPYVEELGLHLAIELHGPWSPSTPVFQEYYELFERKNSDAIGVVPDFSAFCSGAPETVLNMIPDDVCHKEILMKISELYTNTEIPEEELLRQLRAEGGDEIDAELCRARIFSIPEGSHMGQIYYRTRPDYDGFRNMIRHAKYLHGKFWYVNEQLECKGIDYPRYVQIMKEEGYDGYIASEYEGYQLDNTIPDDEQISRHMQMLDKLWEV